MYSKLSIIIPCYNEELFIEQMLNRVCRVTLSYDLEKEIILIDDASSDRTQALIQNFLKSAPQEPIVYIRHEKNSGKGAAIRTGIEQVSGDLTLIQDADLEYDPDDYNKLLKPMYTGDADVVYGSRFIGAGPHRVLFYFHTIGNKFLTFLSNLFTQLNLTDMETGYKLFRTELLKNIRLQENRFGFEPEITAKLSRVRGIRIFEVGIAYYGRTYKEGKKINWRDGIRAIYTILKYNLFVRK